MRSAGNFNPEWGYLAPAPSIFRTARVVIVAAAVGATAAAGVVLALVERPAVKTEAAPAHALVRAIPALPTQELQQPASVVAVPPPVAATAAVQVSVPQASVPRISVPVATPVQFCDGSRTGDGTCASSAISTCNVRRRVVLAQRGAKRSD